MLVSGGVAQNCARKFQVTILLRDPLTIPARDCSWTQYQRRGRWTCQMAAPGGRMATRRIGPDRCWGWWLYLQIDIGRKCLEGHLLSSLELWVILKRQQSSQGTLRGLILNQIHFVWQQAALRRTAGKYARHCQWCVVSKRDDRWQHHASNVHWFFTI